MKLFLLSLLATSAHTYNTTTKNDNTLFFYWKNPGYLRCGDVDAAPRMPAALFEPENKAALQAYINVTIDLYHITDGNPSHPQKTELRQGRCKDNGFSTLLPGCPQSKPNCNYPNPITADWAPKNMMKVICDVQCKCKYPDCKNVPDDPKTKHWCSLCGPKYNAPIKVTLYNASPLFSTARGKNIVELAQSVPDLSTLVTALVAGKLTSTLSLSGYPGPFTVFAPTNEAFAKLPSATLASLLNPKNIKELQKVLTYHVIAGAAVFAKDLKTFQMVKTTEGDDLKIVKAGRVIVGTDGAMVTAADNAATNGVVHIIDGVLIPPSKPTPTPVAPTPPPAPAKNIVELAQSVPDLSTLVTALVAGKLVDTLSGAGPFTVFAPTNEAFAKIPSAALASLLNPKNIKQLQRVLSLHVIAGTAIFKKNLSRGLSGNKPLIAVSGDTLELDNVCTNSKCTMSKLKINPTGEPQPNAYEASVTSGDNEATNGVVHIINTVLTPPANDLYFRGINKVGTDRCGEVNAGARMPASLFDPANAAVLKEYEEITCKLYNVLDGPFVTQRLEVGRCKDVGYDKADTSLSKPPIRTAATLAPWAPPALMDGICALKCNCLYGSAGNSTLPACTDQPDDPKAGKWCSLCGPKYNQGIVIKLFTK